MVEEPAYIKNLKKIARADPSLSDISALEEELYDSPSDRAMVIATTAFVENSLEQLIASKIRKDLNSKDRKRLFEYEGAAGTLSSKIILAYAFKFIGPLTRADLELVRLLRNEFAHSRRPFNFETPEVVEFCAKFQLVNLPETYGPVIRKRFATPITNLSDLVKIKGEVSRTRFMTTCHTITHRLYVAKNGPHEGDIAFPNDDPVP